MKFTLIAVVIALFACQFANTNASPTSSPQVRGVIDTVTEGLKKLTEVIQSAIDLAIDKVQAAFSAIIDLSKKVIDQSTEKIKKLVDYAFAEIKKLQESASDLGIDVVECTKEAEESLLELPTFIVEKLKGCAQAQIDKGLNIFTEGKNKIQGEFNTVAELTQAMKECDGSIICLSGCLAKITAATIRVPLDITQVSIKIADLLAHIQTELALCGTNAVADVTQHTTDILLKVTTCVEKKITGATHDTTFVAQPAQAIFFY